MQGTYLPDHHGEADCSAALATAMYRYIRMYVQKLNIRFKSLKHCCELLPTLTAFIGGPCFILLYQQY